jgi:hypothetical protein
VRPDPELQQRPSAISRDGRREPLSQPSTRRRDTGTPLTLEGGRAGSGRSDRND